ncbi:MAG: hypothetical protein PVG13_11135 [Thiohalophilus sp.]|jgi:hypothetical protein
MTHKTKMTLIRIVLILFVYGFFNPRVIAEIEGITDYKLGDKLDTSNVINIEKSDDGTKIYIVKPVSNDTLMSRLAIQITSKGIIHRITADSSVISSAECYTRINNLRKSTERDHPDLGYYAMDQSELFYQGDRTYTLECIKSENGSRLRQEYSDDKLAGLIGR